MSMKVEKIVPNSGPAEFSNNSTMHATNSEAVFERKENPRLVRFIAKPRNKKKRGMR